MQPPIPNLKVVLLAVDRQRVFEKSCFGAVLWRALGAAQQAAADLAQLGFATGGSLWPQSPWFRGPGRAVPVS